MAAEMWSEWPYITLVSNFKTNEFFCSSPSQLITHRSLGVKEGNFYRVACRLFHYKVFLKLRHQSLWWRWLMKIDGADKWPVLVGQFFSDTLQSWYEVGSCLWTPRAGFSTQNFPKTHLEMSLLCAIVTTALWIGQHVCTIRLRNHLRDLD
jgi:hypothetical protein